MDELVSFSLDTNDFSSLSERDGNDSCIFKIAGITKYLKIEDAFSFGIAVGYIQVEEDNPYDSDALGIYTKNNQLIGYVSKKRTNIIQNFYKEKKDTSIINSYAILG